MTSQPTGAPLTLPPGFRFGTTAAAYCVEGAAEADGRGPSIWDTFTQQPGRVVDGSSGAVAADQYHRLDEDVVLLKGLGVQAHKFSVSWPRVLPEGRGPVNAKGLDYYDRLVDRLLAHGIEPMATLYHWDLPQALEDDGGWLNRGTVDAFAQYAEVVAERLADRVAHWIPVHEPGIAASLGYGNGTHAPGRRLFFDSLVASHHLLLAHGRGAIALRAAGAVSVGCANNHNPIWPASQSDADVGAAKFFDTLWNGLYIEPTLLGRFPDDVAPMMADIAEPGDLVTIRQPLDFYGVNYYFPMRLGAAPEDAELPFELREVLGYPLTDLGRPVVPDALREWLIMFRARYRAALPPLVLTETGCADNTEPGPDGTVDDQRRIDFLAAHLGAVQEAIARGVDVRGFYCWSLLDGFEWIEGLTQRFGLVHVDHETLVRTPKRSYQWYADVIAAQARAAG
ncbi:beta-glucosidase [Nocardioides gansuensis]|uniref:Beta-glucosidase n=1 Tax=Nocardioides gansuensis TaxID=2138300 RepID=A0A2T8FES4_9ACTN|nr:GH1 family beta-glucosidase [Nocardioides gansuensis]PVG84228.1 beta-glucosidase [Nocardioides gansuensis]